MQELSGETGITPAYAGKRQRRATACTWLRDHPRVCGEKDAICKSCPARQGSPSRMRGKAGWPLCGLPCIGITPAYAGKSQPWRSYSQRRWDHPRVCGEKIVLVIVFCSLMGSPPRMRGKAKCQLDNVRCGRITPAYAGKSFSPSACIGHYRDHPRVCGEKPGSKQPENPHQGSPPRMRGKGLSAPPACWQIGITPAYAGKSFLLCGGDTWFRDHPRVCGEKCRGGAFSHLFLGSPPRMRGKEPLVDRAPSGRGITPAYAGKRLKRSHRIGHFSCILCLFHSVLHRASASGGSRAGPCAPPCLPAQNAVPV